MIFLPAPVLALLATLISALEAANLLDTPYAFETEGRPYFAIKAAFLTTFATALTEAKVQNGDEVASRIYDEMISNGEDLAYNIDLWNRGLIDLFN